MAIVLQELVGLVGGSQRERVSERVMKFGDKARNLLKE
jgi:hypothetical protein